MAPADEDNGSNGETSDDGLFLTALPGEVADSGQTEVVSEDTAAAFLEDVGYNRLVSDLADAGVEDEAFSQLVAKADQLLGLQRVVDELRANLAQKQQQNAVASQKDAAAQKESDAKMERIRTMEEQAHRIEGSTIPSLEQQAKQLFVHLGCMKTRIEEGPGWKDEQTQQRTSRSNAIDQSRTEANAKSSRLADLRAQLKAKEKEVEAAVAQRDESLANIDELNGKTDRAQEQVLAAEQEYNEAERSKGILAEALRVANSELADLTAERDREQQLTDHCAQEVDELQSKQQSCSKDFNELAKGEDNTKRELDKIRAENREIQEANNDKQRSLDVLSKERDGLLKERAKSSTLLELIDKKAVANEKARGVLQSELDELNARAAKLENDVPLGRKEIEVLKREIRRAEQEHSLVGRKIGLSKKESTHVLDLAKSNENTLRSQETELGGIKRAVRELQKTRQALVEEESRDEERLARIYEVLREKQRSLQSLEDANRALESSSAEAEETVRDQHKLCEVAREEHNVEAKALIALRETVHQAKTELVTLATQMRRIKDEIARADDLVFKEHVLHHQVDAEREAIESDVASFSNRTAKLEERRALNISAIAQLDREIDADYNKREAMRQTYRHILGEKDILGANLIAAEGEHRRISEAIEAHGTMNSISDSRFGRLLDELAVAKAKTRDLLKKKIAAKASLELQRERIQVLASLQLDLSKQVDKNSALTADIGEPVHLHRWRALRDRSPNEYALLEKIHALQRQVIKCSDKIASQSRNNDGKKAALSQLRSEAAGQKSVDDIQMQLLSLRSELQALSGDLRQNEADLQQRIGVAEDIKQDLVELEKKRAEMKASYIVSVINAR